jgi:hypothetical protein
LAASQELQGQENQQVVIYTLAFKERGTLSLSREISNYFVKRQTIFLEEKSFF